MGETCLLQNKKQLVTAGKKEKANTLILQARTGAGSMHMGKHVGMQLGSMHAVEKVVLTATSDASGRSSPVI